MKDARFIELVNLYIDRQISPAETAELELEIQACPRHRRIYQQYCHMHRATKLVYESFRADAEQPAVTGVQPGSIAYFAQRRQRVRRNFWLSSLGGLAAAACLAFYFVRGDAGNPSSSAAKIAIAATQTAPTSASVAPHGAVDVSRLPALVLAPARDARTFALSQSDTVRPVSLFDDGMFDAKPNLNGAARTVFPAKAKADAQVPTELSAFQFQR